MLNRFTFVAMTMLATTAHGQYAQQPNSAAPVQQPNTAQPASGANGVVIKSGETKQADDKKEKIGYDAKVKRDPSGKAIKEEAPKFENSDDAQTLRNDHQLPSDSSLINKR